MLLNIRDYVKLAAPEPEVLKLIGAEAERSGASALTSRQIYEVIKRTRAEKRGVDALGECVAELAYNVRQEGTVLIELPAEIEDSVKAQALLRGLSVEAYLRDVVERDLRLGGKSGSPHHPLKSGWGLCADLGPAPSAEEIDANRAEMFCGFGESF